MDFSTPERSLQSLPRRKPSLPDCVLTLASKLLELRAKGAAATAADEEEYGSGALALIRDHGSGDRWEPLAVGIYLAADFLSRQTGALKSSAGTSSPSPDGAKPEAGGEGDDGGRPRTVSLGGGEYYAEGPRVPATTPSTLAAAEEMLHHDEVVDGVAPPPSPSGTAASGAAGVVVARAGPAYMVTFCSALLEACESNMEHREPRVRTLVSKVMGAHSRYGLALSSLGDADPAAVDAASKLAEQRRGVHAKVVEGLHRQMELGRDTSGKKSKSSAGALDDTTGWRALETHLHALAAFVDGCGGAYVTEEDGVRDEKLLSALESCCNDHVNRHVRAAGIAVLDRMVLSVSAAAGEENLAVLTDPQSELRRVVVAVLKVTLADNWSQVRMAASVLCRTFLLALIRTEAEGGGEEDEDALDGLYPILLPRMCLNRFYLAQGVKLYSHDTWKMVFPPGSPRRSGLEKVASCAGPVCRYYCKMCDADNHVVREAACQAVAELASKIGTHPDHSESLSPYVPALLQALLLCFHDESWPVRDEAALACGTFCRAYPEECRPELDTLFGRWVEQLTDQIWSVREDAGVALGDAVVAYGPEMYEKVLAVLREAIPSAKSQPAMTKEEYKKRENDMEAHTNNQLYSCGSLAPKLKKGSAVNAEGQQQEGGGAPGKGRIGCTSCFVDRPKAPWERTDGCIYLLRELCAKCCGPSGEAFVQRGIDLNDDTLMPLMTELVDACRLKHYPQSDDLRATLWRQLPPMATSLGKTRFKRKYLQMFLDPLMSNLDDRYGGGASALSVHAAGQCAEELAAIVGRGIFRGRLEEDWQQAAFDRVMEERARTAGMGPAPGGMEPDFSPFGPPGLVPGAGIAGGAGPASFPVGAVGRMPQTTAGGQAVGTGGTFPSSSPSKPAVPGTGMMDAL